ncbi:MAG: recombination mediator RecR [Sulfuricurvum sp.]|uniref:recombination mediator RecR n=1 Tax=Sulfuricurvum sp. TaxID=2025608 RepID=UPI00261705ED|nr:recombination mediator RecR [Sulfuricurvum sp.]MDD3595414.1 recombination mediator RecR [Sulfuricurvum sp.]MDD4884649.1 recombination mediator RecR [Sulfuricurvum sp.]
MKRSLEKFNRLVEALQQLPTIGQKSATRLAYHMVMNDSFGALKLAHAIENAITSLKKCRSCGGLSEDELCEICSDERRNHEILCIVENAKDILTFEENALFDGRYFVLDALDELDLSHLRSIVQSGIKEVIFALTPSIANQGVMLYIEDKLSDCDVRFSRIAQGVPTGVSLENVDILSLTKAMEDRVGI